MEENNFLKLKEIQNGLLTLGHNETANAGKFSYEFVSLAKIRQKLQYYFDKFDWILLQPIVYKDNEQYLETQIIDAKKQDIIISTSIKIPINVSIENIQKFGGIITYLRRYSLVTLLGLTTEKDDDCFISSEEAINKVNLIENINELMKLYKELGDDRIIKDNKLKDAFSKKKKEFLKLEAEKKEEILKKVQVDE